MKLNYTLGFGFIKLKNHEFGKIRTAVVTGNATNYKNGQDDNPICSTRDEISQPSRPISPRAATAWDHSNNLDFEALKLCASV